MTAYAMLHGYVLTEITGIEINGRPFSVGDILNMEAALLSERTASEAALKEARERIAREVRCAIDAKYMAHAYYNMLGEKGLEVAKMWSAKGTKRVHINWGPEARELTGEERAAHILTWEAAPRSRVENIDGDDIP